MSTLNESSYSSTSESSKINNYNKPPEFKTLIKKYVELLQLKMNTDEMKFRKKFHFEEYTQKLAEYVPKFYDEYPHLFKMIISGADLEILDIFLDNITDIDNGKKTLTDARSDLGNLLHNKYVDNKLKSKKI